MENPYQKTKEDEDWINASMVPRHFKLRWLWFHHNKTLWMSTDRIQALTHHPRDYILPILERYVRRFGYANEAFFHSAYERICRRRRIGSQARWHYPDMDRFGVFPDGDYVPVYFEGDATCPFCEGSKGYIVQTKIGEELTFSALLMVIQFSNASTNTARKSLALFTASTEWTSRPT